MTPGLEPKTAADESGWRQPATAKPGSHDETQRRLQRCGDRNRLPTFAPGQCAGDEAHNAAKRSEYDGPDHGCP